MARTQAVAALVLGTLLGLTQFGVALGSPVSANVHTSRSGFGSSSGAAQSEYVDTDGTVKGECAYVGPDGNTIKVTYAKPPNGQVRAEANVRGVDPLAALATCRTSAEAASAAARESFRNIEESIRQQQQQLQAMQQQFFSGFQNQFAQFPFGGHGFF